MTGDPLDRLDTTTRRVLMRLRPLRERPRETPGAARGAWWTPPALASKVAAWAGIDGRTRVVDLGAGLGALSVAALELGAFVTSIEIDKRLFNRMGDRLDEHERWAGVGGDVFVSELDRLCADVAILNPPFEDDLPERFIMRALDFAPRAVAIVPVNVACGSARARDLWSRVIQTREARLARRPSFDVLGKNGQRDIVVIEVARRADRARDLGEADVVRVEYWPDRWNGADRG